MTIRLNNSLTNEDKSFLKKILGLSSFIGGLCCFTPVVLVLLGISSVSFAASLSDNLYYNYRWAFRGVALFTLLAGLVWYFYKKQNICTIDEFKRQRNKIINTTLIALILGTILYIIWLYVIVEILGVVLGIWELY